MYASGAPGSVPSSEDTGPPGARPDAVGREAGPPQLVSDPCVESLGDSAALLLLCGADRDTEQFAEKVQIRHVSTSDPRRGGGVCRVQERVEHGKGIGR